MFGCVDSMMNLDSEICLLTSDSLFLFWAWLALPMMNLVLRRLFLLFGYLVWICGSFVGLKAG